MNLRAKRIVPVVLGIAMFGVVVAAAMAPNVGLVSAQASTPYSQPSSAPSGLSTLDWLAIAVVLIVAAFLAALLFMRRRRQPPTAEVPPAPGGGPPPGAAGAPPAPPPAPPAAAPAYLETPEDVGQTLPVVPTAPAGAAAGAAAGAGAAEAEPDIDSLMAELDKISGEILKRAPKKGEPPAETQTGEQKSQ